MKNKSKSCSSSVFQLKIATKSSFVSRCNNIILLASHKLDSCANCTCYKEIMSLRAYVLPFAKSTLALPLSSSYVSLSVSLASVPS